MYCIANMYAYILSAGCMDIRQLGYELLAG